MRHRAVQALLEHADDSIVRPAKFLSFRLVVMTATLFLFTASGAVGNSDTIFAAETGNPVNSAPAAAPVPARTELTPKAAQSELSDTRPSVVEDEMSLPRERRPNLAALLAIRSSGNGSSKRTTPGAALADAIDLGPTGEVEPENPFLNRKMELFRAVHPVSIGNSDLLVRFRVRAKLRETMSLDFLF